MTPVSVSPNAEAPEKWERRRMSYIRPLNSWFPRKMTARCSRGTSVKVSRKTAHIYRRLPRLSYNL